MDEDYLLALHLQEQFNNEYDAPILASNDVGQSANKRKVEINGGALVPWKRSVNPERPLSIVDPSWETLDPTPDVRAMFLEFNSRFFWDKLSGVEVKWSPRMTLCAGVCSYEGRGGLCSIRLSEPLLKLRPRKDLVETLLHEMIHALLFVTHNNRDREGHGPEFCKHMNRINKDSGTNITVYHNFNDEVDVYRQHWWRCDGPCQNRRPYFGYVKRAMNRAPSALDPWWGDHQRTCGGTYTKVKEPEGYGKKKGKKEVETNGKTSAREKPSGSGFVSRDIRDIIPFSGKGLVLGGTPSKGSAPPPTSSSGPASSGSPPLKRPHNMTGGGLFPSLDQKTLLKKSVANTKVFVSINGSPVRISKTSRGADKSQGAERGTQPSIEDLFTKSARRSSAADSQTDLRAAACNGNNNSIPVSSAGTSQRPKCTSSIPSGSTTTVAEPPQSKKRPPEDSYSIFDVFNKRLRIESKETLPASAPQASSASSSYSSSVVVMVNCPVCEASVQETNINQHLDSCLS
ncbi:DNA-dependent metalloprotease SPRTN [Dunckerocampus dactyliophorus]|uniref:DNA-dependent metalloprotease SPRTN n=1 Tax=Dunckerocampus dactyliophorus TaxID=161453 RepID=UPI002406A786|nr:DNA-dependent metalloprotease SPRTN [Dunckerocampus dactyliophorus]